MRQMYQYVYSILPRLLHLFKINGSIFPATGELFLKLSTSEACITTSIKKLLFSCERSRDSWAKLRCRVIGVQVHTCKCFARTFLKGPRNFPVSRAVSVSAHLQKVSNRKQHRCLTLIFCNNRGCSSQRFCVKWC